MFRFSMHYLSGARIAALLLVAALPGSAHAQFGGCAVTGTWTLNVSAGSFIGTSYLLEDGAGTLSGYSTAVTSGVPVGPIVGSRSGTAVTVAVVGFAVRFPGSGPDLDHFWRNVASAADCSREVPPGLTDLNAEVRIRGDLDLLCDEVSGGDRERLRIRSDDQGRHSRPSRSMSTSASDGPHEPGS